MNASVIRSISLALPILFASLRPAHGQVDPDSAKHRNICRLAEQVVTTENPEPHSEWAWQYIGLCEPSQKVRVYRTAMQQARTSADTMMARRAIMRLIGFRDGALFNEVLDIASGRSASVPARVAAFVALAAIRDPWAAPHYEGFIGGLDERGIPRGWCSHRTAHPVGYEKGPTPLPSDYLERITMLRERVRLDSAEPADVRSAAACT